MIWLLLPTSPFTKGRKTVFTKNQEIFDNNEFIDENGHKKSRKMKTCLEAYARHPLTPPKTVPRSPPLSTSQDTQDSHTRHTRHVAIYIYNRETQTLPAQDIFFLQASQPIVIPKTSSFVQKLGPIHPPLPIILTADGSLSGCLIIWIATRRSNNIMLNPVT